MKVIVLGVLIGSCFGWLDMGSRLWMANLHSI
jgi:hypothetical protein